MKVFRVEGTFRMGRTVQRFRKEVAAKDEIAAQETVCSDLGSKHRTPRRAIRISSITALPPDKITDSVARAKAGIAP